MVTKDGKNCNMIMGIFAVTSKEKCKASVHEAKVQSSLVGSVPGGSQTADGSRTARDEGAVE